jgi:hypothetical protein
MNDRKTPTLDQLAQFGKKSFRCSRCGKAFPKIQGLTMHTVRVHTHRFPKQYTPEEKKERKRAYNRRYARMVRERKQAQGLTVRGYKPRRRFTPYVLHRETPEQPAPTIKYCPHCGNSLEKYL